MTTSANTDFNPAAFDIITEALALIRVGVDEEPLTDSMTEDAMRSLNLMVKAYQAQGLHLWTKTEGVLFLSSGQAAYPLGGSVSTNSCLYSDLAVTTLSADVASGARTLTVTSITGIADDDAIAIELSDGTLQWTTVRGTPFGTTVNIDDALTDTADSGNALFAYTAKLLRPTRLLQARRRIFATDMATFQDIPLTIQERPDYYDQPTKFQPSTETMIYYDPQLISGILNLWMAPSTETDLVLFTFERPLEQFYELTNTADLPQEWLEALTYNLAYRLAPKYSFPLSERALLKVDAKEKLDLVLGFDREYGSVFFQPDFTQGGGFDGGAGWD